MTDEDDPEGPYLVQVRDTWYLLPDRPRLYVCKPCGTEASFIVADYYRFSCDCGCSCENHWSEDPRHPGTLESFE